MKKMFSLVLVSISFVFYSTYSVAQMDVVAKHGQLSVSGNYMVSAKGDTVQLRGMSLFWSQWMPQYYTSETVKWLKDDWKCTVIRAAMGVDHDGYATNPGTEMAKVIAVVEAAIESGIYVIIDYHSHEAHKDPEQAVKFFSYMAKKYGKYSNVFYEIYNEPLQNISWSKDIKPYSEKVIAAIREHDPDNIIIVGTRQWSQLVSEAADNPIEGKNLMYTLHFYAVSHGQYLRDEAEAAMKKGIAIFVTEFGTCDYTGDGDLGIPQTEEWFAFLDKYKISWCNWSVSDKKETAAILKPNTGEANWEDYQITPSGLFIKGELIKKYNLELKSYRKKK